MHITPLVRNDILIIYKYRNTPYICAYLILEFNNNPSVVYVRNMLKYCKTEKCVILLLNKVLSEFLRYNLYSRETNQRHAKK